MDEHVTVEPPRPVPLPRERPLRSLTSILLRAGAGFLLGALLSLSSCSLVNPQSLFPGQDISPDDKTAIALAVGVGFGILTGLFFWVLFPYQPGHNLPEAHSNETESTEPLH
jgi:hypothetical protein